jgi:hypothetical protein
MIQSKNNNFKLYIQFFREKLEDLAVVGQETESIQEDRKPAAKKRPCCACCKDEEEVG